MPGPVVLTNRCTEDRCPVRIPADRDRCSSHTEMLLAASCRFVPQTTGPVSGYPYWRRCARCGGRRGLHRQVAAVEELPRGD